MCVPATVCLLPGLHALAQAGGAQGRDALAKVVPPFLRFLEEAGAFYQALIMRLQARYGDVGINMELPRRMAAARPTQATSSGTVTSEAAAQVSAGGTTVGLPGPQGLWGRAAAPAVLCVLNVTYLGPTYDFVCRCTGCRRHQRHGTRAHAFTGA